MTVIRGQASLLESSIILVLFLYYCSIYKKIELAFIFIYLYFNFRFRF